MKTLILFLFLTVVSTSVYAGDSILVSKSYKTQYAKGEFSETERSLRGDFINYTSKEKFGYDLSQLKTTVNIDSFNCDMWLQCNNYLFAFDFVDPGKYMGWMQNAETIFAKKRINAAVYDFMKILREIPGAEKIPAYQTIDDIYQAAGWDAMMDQYKVNAIIKVVNLKTMKVKMYEINTSETLTIFGPFTMFPDAKRDKFSLSFLVDLTTVPAVFSDAFKKAKDDK